MTKKILTGVGLTVFLIMCACVGLGAITSRSTNDESVSLSVVPTTAPEPPTTAPEPPTTAPEPPTTAPEPPTTAPEPPTTAPEPPTTAPEPPVSNALTEEDIAYVNAVVPPIELISAALSSIGRNMLNYRPDNPDVGVQLAAASIALIEGHNQLEALTPPPRFEAVHKQMLSGAAQCKLVGEGLPTALDTRNASLFNDLSEAVTQCGEQLTVANAMLQDVVDPRQPNSDTTIPDSGTQDQGDPAQQDTAVPAIPDQGDPAQQIEPLETDCDPSYPDVCIPPYPPDLNCSDIPHQQFRVLPPDPHKFDQDGNGIGCENK